MPRYQYLQNAFSSGEISPKVFPRVDTAEYANGLKEANRFCIGKTGGMFRTPGFLSEGIESTANIAYYYKSEVGSDPVQFKFTDSAIVGISLTAPALANYVLAYANDPKGFTLVKANDFYVITHNSGLYEPWVCFRDLKVSATFITGAQLSGLEALIVAQGIQGTVGNIPSENLYPYTDFGSNNISLTPSAISGSITLTASSSFFVADDVGSRFIIEDPTHSDSNQKALSCTITAVGSGTSATATVDWVVGSYSAGASTMWVRNAWSERLGYPKTVSFSNNRIVFANTKSSPNGVWASEQYFFLWFNQYTEFLSSTLSATTFYYYGSYGYIYINSVTVSPPQTAPFNYVISSKFGGEIKWLSDFDGLVAGSSEKIYYILGSEGRSPSRSDIQVNPIANFRCSYVPPEFSKEAMFVVDDLQRNIVKLELSSENRGFTISNITSISEDILDYLEEDDSTKIINMAWSDYTDALWVVADSGKLFSFFYAKESGVAGWAKQTIDATVHWAVSDDSTGKIKLSVTLPASLNSEYTTLNMASFFYGSTLNDTCKYLDFGYSGVSASDGSAIVPSSSYSYLYNKTLTVIDENGDITEVTLDGSGIFQLPTAAQLSYTIGVLYDSRFSTLTPNIGANQLLNSQGDIIRIDRCTAYLYKSWAGQYSGDDSNFYDMEIDMASNTLKYPFDLNSSPDIDSSVTIKSVGALPLNVTGLVMRGTNNP